MSRVLNFCAFLLLSMYCLFIGAPASSQEVDELLAKRVARRYFHERLNEIKLDINDIKIKNCIPKRHNGHSSYFIFNLENGGWIIAAAHKACGPIIAYSFAGSLSEDNFNPAFSYLLEQFEHVIDNAYSKKTIDARKMLKWQELSDSIINEPNLKSFATVSDPENYLIRTKWGQGTKLGEYKNCGYNQLMPNCPYCISPCNMDNYCDGKCLAGCGPVAVAQILNYWAFATGDYADFNWWNMGNGDFASGIPYLLKRCGDRLGITYCGRGCASGFDETESVMKQSFREFGYREDELNYIEWNFLTGYNTWVDKLKTEILAGRPIYYGAGPKKYGHAFICDGYDSANNNFHWNFGYNGHCDAWMDFEDLSAEFDGGSKLEGLDELHTHTALIGIKPNVINEQYLKNIELNTGTNDPWPNNKTFQAKSAIIAAGENSYFHINNTSECRFLAENMVVLKPGFHVSRGARFNAKVYRRPVVESSTIPQIQDCSNAMGSIDGEEAKEISIYPNPASSGININYKGFNEGVVGVLLLNALGNCILQFEMDHNDFYVNLTDLPDGIYFIRIIDCNCTNTSKLIKRKL